MSVRQVKNKEPGQEVSQPSAVGIHAGHLLKWREQQLNSLLQVTQAINNNVSARGLLKLYENLLVKQLGAKRMALVIHHSSWMCTNAFGIDRHDAEALILPHLLSFGQITNLHRTGHPLAEHFEMVIPVYHKDVPLAFTFLSHLEAESGTTLEDELNYLQTISSVVSVAIENKKLFRAQMKQKFIKSEMELAGQMQIMLIPGTLPDDERITVAGVYLPQQEVGGDYYDYIQVNDDECFFCIADISGKGIAAALLMANFQASVRSYAEKENSLHILVEQLNKRVSEITKGEKFITLFMARFSHLTRRLEYVNAGHNPALLIYNGEVKSLQEGCTLLGMFEKLPYIKVQQMVLPEPFTIFCYTDGLIDLENDKKEIFDMDRLLDFVRRNGHLEPAALNGSMIDHIVSFKGRNRIQDDISLLTCRIHSQV